MYSLLWSCPHLIVTFILAKIFARSFICAVWTVLEKWGHTRAAVYTGYLFVIQRTLLWAMRRNRINFFSFFDKRAQTALYWNVWWLELLWLPGQRLVPVQPPRQCELLLSVGRSKWVALSLTVVKQLNRVMLICWTCHLSERSVSATLSSHAYRETTRLKIRFCGSQRF